MRLIRWRSAVVLQGLQADLLRALFLSPVGWLWRQRRRYHSVVLVLAPRRSLLREEVVFLRFSRHLRDFFQMGQLVGTVLVIISLRVHKNEVVGLNVLVLVVQHDFRPLGVCQIFL